MGGIFPGFHWKRPMDRILPCAGERTESSETVMLDTRPAKRSNGMKCQAGSGSKTKKDFHIISWMRIVLLKHKRFLF